MKPKPKRRSSVAKPFMPRVARFASRSSFLSDDEANLAGRELLKIATENGVGDVRQLDKHMVWAAIEADKNHPLRALRFWDWDVQTAAEKHWLYQTDQLIKNVVVVVARPGPRPRYVPLFVSAEAPSESGSTRRARVVRDDALASQPVFMSHVGGTLRQIKNLLNGLQDFCASGSPPDEVLELLHTMRTAFDRYASRMHDEEAAAE